MADLSQVVNGTALPDYLDPVLFFRNTFPTRGLRGLMKAVWEEGRLGAEPAS